MLLLLPITKCHNDSLGLKLVYICILTIFLSFFNVFINIHEYAKLSTCMLYNFPYDKRAISKRSNEINFSGLK